MASVWTVTSVMRATSGSTSDLALTEVHGDKLDLRAVNRNFCVLIDRDLAHDDAGPLGAEKQRPLAEAEALGPIAS